jgi:hypothetical protein
MRHATRALIRYGSEVTSDRLAWARFVRCVAFTGSAFLQLRTQNRHLVRGVVARHDLLVILRVLLVKMPAKQAFFQAKGLAEQAK